MVAIQKSLVAVALVIAAVMLLPTTSPVFTPDGPVARVADRLAIPGAEDAEGRSPAVDALLPDATGGASEVRERPDVPAVKGILMTGYTVGGERFEQLLGLIGRTELNAVVIDIKDEAGELSWLPQRERAAMAGAGRRKIPDPAAEIKRLKDAGAYVIGRVVTFQDPVLAEARPDLAVADARGGTWKTEKGLGWVDPYSPEVWAYVIDVAKEAVDVGFDEIQFDYVRFATDGDVGRIWYPHRDARPPTEVIRSFLAAARRELHASGANVSIDLFGLVTLVTDDLGIGQRIEILAREVDYVSPMLYPSHYEAGNYELPDPEAEPAKTVALSLRDAKRRMAGSGAKLRPWLQDFSLRIGYSPAHVRAQIDAAESEGVHEWLLWNAGNRYSEDALRPADARPRAASNDG